MLSRHWLAPELSRAPVSSQRALLKKQVSARRDAWRLNHWVDSSLQAHARPTAWTILAHDDGMGRNAARVCVAFPHMSVIVVCMRLEPMHGRTSLLTVAGHRSPARAPPARTTPVAAVCAAFNDWARALHEMTSGCPSMARGRKEEWTRRLLQETLLFKSTPRL
jgi:hypothetical protein